MKSGDKQEQRYDGYPERSPRLASPLTSRIFLLTSLLLGVVSYVTMYHFQALLTITAAIIPGLVKTSAQSDDLATWMLKETPIALHGILSNIGGTKRSAVDASPGIVVASPSKSNPDYFYTWTRDAGLTIKCLIDELLAGNAEVETTIQDYISAQAYLQTVSNPSGDICSGGLAEPKFNVDETAYSGAWGRPQRDGPALRAIALIAYAKLLLGRGEADLVANTIWPIVQNDLSYVTQFWNSSTFDLWEEIDSSSFFTTAVQYRALVEGSSLATSINQTCPHCDSQSPLVLCLLQTYWNGEYILSNTGGGRSGKDINSVLTSIHLFDQNAGCDDLTLQPCSDRALANHRVVVDSFRSIYAINDGISGSSAVAVGRYSEDVYQGGHPWYLGVFAAAEQLYYAMAQWQKQETINVTLTSLSFFTPLMSSVTVGVYRSDSTIYADIVNAVQTYADGYMLVARRYTPADGSLAEQFSRTDGQPLSALNLTWSYAAFLTARNARTKVLPPSWGAAGAARQLPRDCIAGSASGPCATASRPVWPGRPTSTSAPCTTPSLTSIEFSVLRKTSVGQNVFVAGNRSELGGWRVEDAVALSAEKYSDNNPLWTGTVLVESGSAVEYKYVVKSQNGAIMWENDPNRSFGIVTSCNGRASRADSWR